MKKFLLFVIFFYGSLQLLYSQDNVKEDGVVSFSLPIRNSLKFNKFLINPAFSFVREQGSYLSFYNKKQWVQFDNAPQTYFFSYAGRFRENQGVALGFFQQNYGVLTTFGGVINFAQNIVLDQDSNLTFGLNLGFYKSGLNTGKVITNYPDASLDNIPSNFLFSANPGINYGTAFLDFGISFNNVFLYNLKTSQIVQDDPEKSIELHAMHTGYLETSGFFDRSKFSALVKTDLKKEKTVISGLVMFTIPSGVWAQGGYNTLYGMSAGLGLNITPKISIEYNFEKATGNLASFGASHEITLAYKFKSNKYYQDDEETEGAIINVLQTNKSVASKPKPVTPTPDNSVAAAKAAALEVAKANALAKAATDAKNKADAEARTKLALENQAKAVALAKATADAKNKADVDARAKLVLVNQAKAIALAKATADAKIKAEADAKAKAVVQAKPKAVAPIKVDTDAKAKAAALAQEKLAADAKAKLAAETQAKAAALAQEKLNAEAKAKLAAEAQAKAAALAQEKLNAEAKAKLAAEAQAKAAALAQEKLNAEAKAKLAAEAQAKAAALAQEKLNADAKAAADAKAKLAAEAQAKAAALAQEKLNAEAKIKAELDAKAKLAAEAQAKAAALAQEKLDAEARLAAEERAKAAALAQVEAKDDNARSMKDLTQYIEESKSNQEELLSKLDATVADREKELKDLKDENDLSDKGIFKEPKAFKSISGQNSALAALQSEISELNKNQNTKILALENLYKDRLKKGNKNDATAQYYLKTIETLKTDQLKAIQMNSNLIASLEKIKEGTEIEKKRRIKRASFENDQGRYLNDVATLKRIKETTPVSKVAFKPEDFDFGEEQSNMQILKSPKNVEGGYYLVLAVHSDVAKRDEFLRKAVAAGEKNINFFYDVNTSKYFIYYTKFDSIEQAKLEQDSKGSKPYNGKMVLVRVED